ncbi:MAG: DUF4954 family protein [Spirochaetia bacterium]|nr:DUF4954 family protein [Spirochaetia bacterium]
MEIMVKIEDYNCNEVEVPSEFIIGKRHLTASEILILEKNQNTNIDKSWNNFYVDEKDFDPELIQMNAFSGFVVIGSLRRIQLHYHDLILPCGIYKSHLRNVCLGDDFAVHNVEYFENYKTGSREIFFNVQEISCTNHSKFGNGILKQGEPEDKRMWIGIGNENDGRRVLAFENLIPADAYIWSHYRDDKQLLERFVQLTEYGNSGKLDTIGFIDDDCVIKNTHIVKDVKIGKGVYIKGALKLKNLTILSTEEEPAQIGEGVVLVNGILGYGSRVFYSAMAIRFVIGRNCQVKYGARVLNSILGDNSTISCCEVLNNLIYPFHEQHHNSSFLIATTIQGQSNIAAGATIGSNHNSRSPDGEIFAKRGFWPGLCSDFKHNSRFASFCLVSKGSYQYELDIPYPFALIAPGCNGSQSISIIPAWWYMYDMFAITRNKNKFLKRDKRINKIQHIETDPLAPDTIEEVMNALERLIGLTAEYLKKIENEYVVDETTPEGVFQRSKDFLHQNPEADFTLEDPSCQKKFGAVIHKPVAAYKMYRKLVKYFAASTLMDFCKSQGVETLTKDLLEEIRKLPLFKEWENVGGQVIPSEKIRELLENIKKGNIKNWQQVHNFYDKCDAEYEQYKIRYALYLLESLYSRPLEHFSVDLFRNITDDVTVFAFDIYNAAHKSREKDYVDYYRTMMYRNKQEMDSVLGSLENNDFLRQLQGDTKVFVNEISKVFKGLV